LPQNILQREVGQTLFSILKYCIDLWQTFVSYFTISLSPRRPMTCKEKNVIFIHVSAFSGSAKAHLINHAKHA